jgi:hypothetical protein
MYQKEIKNMKTLLSVLSVILMLSGFNTLVFADKENRQSGTEVSGEHKSEQGAEHGQAYAGSKEKNEEENKEDKDKKDK